MQGLPCSLDDSQALNKLVGNSLRFRKLIDDLPAVARSGAPVLITGETGTGKELAARALHYLSSNSPFPFVAINCGSLPESLLEDELFGHERGSYTDAHMRRRGLFSQAEKGTLFLDEVDALPPKAQVDLLRVLQDKTYRPIGGSVELVANVSVVAASNASIDRLIKDGGFRCDLYYRLCVFSLHLPPLRERPEDVLPLALHFLAKHRPPDRPQMELSLDAQGLLCSYDWPGNVRELESAIVRGINFAPGVCIDVEHLRMANIAIIEPKAPLLGPGKLDSFRKMKQALVDRFERDYLIRLMEEHRGNITHAALSAGKERRDLGKLLKRHQLNPKQFQTLSESAA